MTPLFEAPQGYRFVKEGEKIQAEDVVCNDFGGAEFRIGPNHAEIGNEWDATCMPMLRRTN
jgi:hypothetical protein